MCILEGIAEAFLEGYRLEVHLQEQQDKKTTLEHLYAYSGFPLSF